MPTLTLYTRPGCHLCDQARSELTAMLAERPAVSLAEIDIDSDERLLRELLELIPVVELDGARISELVLDRDAVSAALDTVAR